MKNPFPWPVSLERLLFSKDGEYCIDFSLDVDDTLETCRLKNHCQRIFDANAFDNYVANESFRQGFYHDIELRHFLDSWTDTLIMQEQLRGKITDKYPASLLQLHQILSFQEIELREEVDQSRLACVLSRQKQYEYKPTSSRLMVISPQSREDIVDEAIQQNSCLISYSSRWLNGSCMIFFIREQSSPEHSLVTVEVRDQKIVQAKGLLNRSLRPEEQEFLEKWADYKGLQIDL